MMTAEKTPEVALLEGFIALRQREGETWSEAVDRFAEEIADRSARSVWRWLAGESAIPFEVIDKIHAQLERED